jgi:CheY-like chemotaxis protein
MGRGSHFRLSFPSNEAKLQQQVEKQRENKRLQKLQELDIFVLDDNEDNIRLAEVFLRRLGCRVRGFTSAKTLFAELTSLTPDLILLDIHMPEMSGFEVFAYLRKIGFKNPIWALTAYSLNEDIQEILQYGFDDYIRKPVTTELLRKKLVAELADGTQGEHSI